MHVVIFFLCFARKFHFEPRKQNRRKAKHETYRKRKNAKKLVHNRAVNFAGRFPKVKLNSFKIAFAAQ